jgi:hypothetical protein
MDNRLYRTVEWLERSQSPFAIARLIMMSGINLRKIGPSDPEDRRSMIRIEQAARSILSTADLAVVHSLLRDETR